MTEQLLLPQWAQSRQEVRAASAQQTIAAIGRVFGEIGQGLTDLFQRLAACIADALKPVIQAIRQVARPLGIVRHRKRSSRRLKVQATRLALGLSPAGRYSPPTRYVNAYGLRGTRKEEIARAVWEREFRG